MRAAIGGVILAGGAALAGCGVLPERGTDPAFPLLAPASLGETIERQQVLRLAVGASLHTFTCVVRVTPEAVLLVGLGPLGQRAFTLTYDASGLRAERAAGGAGAPAPERILADLQMALWPLAALTDATAGTLWRVLEPQPGVRRVLRDGRAYAEIRHDGARRWDGALWLVNFAHDYSLAIESRPLGN